jgi:thioredoxin 1
MTKPLEVNDGTFEQMVLKAELPVLVDFWAPWCGPCLAVAPVLEELAEEYSGKVNIARVNVDLTPRTSAKYSIRSIPTLLIFKEGKPMRQLVGSRPKGELKQFLDEVVGE